MICFRLIKKESEAFLEIAAMATVCDVMPLFDENRILVKGRAAPNQADRDCGSAGFDRGESS